MQVPLFRLQCGANSYDWGKIGSSSAAARFAAATPSDNFSISEEKPYAELWMGTHPSLPSKDLTTGRTLLDLIQDNQALMGSEINQRYGKKLPFLFKVLSINKALSIQAHPNKKLAEQLHAKDPKNYPDDNHKPEMTIALTPFTGLCGFRPLAEIAQFLKSVPSLRKLVGDSQSSAFASAISGRETAASESDITGNKKALQEAFTALMKSSKEDIAAATKALLEDVKNGEQFADGVPEAKELSELVPKLNSQFPDDIGLFVLFFLNYVKLDPGEAMFLEADDIHAYISGDIIECMASSDNVIRAGFTPKFKDVSTLTSILTYNYASPTEQKLQPKPYAYAMLNAAAYKSGSICEVYDPPIEEFSVIRTVLGSQGKVTMDGMEGPSIVICTDGSGKISVGPKVEEIKAGYVYFVGATAELVMEAHGDEELISFRAFCEISQDNKL